MSGLGAQGGVDAVCTSDHKRQIADAGVTPSFQPLRKGRGAFDTATFIQNAKSCALWHSTTEQHRLSSHTAPFAVVDLMHGSRAKGMGTPGPVEPCQVVINKVFLRSGPQTTDRANMYPQNG